VYSQLYYFLVTPCGKGTDGPVQISVFNLAGQLIEINDAEGFSGENNFQLQLNQSGIHFIKIATREGSRLAKIMVSKGN
jgi:hypothetical protein